MSEIEDMKEKISALDEQVDALVSTALHLEGIVYDLLDDKKIRYKSIQDNLDAVREHLNRIVEKYHRS